MWNLPKQNAFSFARFSKPPLASLTEPFPAHFPNQVTGWPSSLVLHKRTEGLASTGWMLWTSYTWGQRYSIHRLGVLTKNTPKRIRKCLSKSMLLGIFFRTLLLILPVRFSWKANPGKQSSWIASPDHSPKNVLPFDNPTSLDKGGYRTVCNSYLG